MAEYTSQDLNHLGIISGICNEIGLIENIDKFVGGNNREVSVGEAIQAMIINALGFINYPLYLSPHFFENKPVEILIGEGIRAEDLNEYSLGRALDGFFNYSREFIS